MDKEEEEFNIENIRDLVKMHREMTVVPTECSIHSSQITEEFSINSEDKEHLLKKAGELYAN